MIRNYSPYDRSASLQIFDSNCPKFFMADEREGFEIWLKGQDEGRLAYKNTVAEYFFVVEEKGAVIGCGGFYHVAAENRANLVWGMIDATLHNRGFGTLLFEHRLGRIKELYNNCTISMDTSQFTYPFFEKMGLKVTSIIKDGYGPGLDRYDME